MFFQNCVCCPKNNQDQKMLFQNCSTINQRQKRLSQNMSGPGDVIPKLIRAKRCCPEMDEGQEVLFPNRSGPRDVDPQDVSKHNET